MNKSIIRTILLGLLSLSMSGFGMRQTSKIETPDIWKLCDDGNRFSFKDPFQLVVPTTACTEPYVLYIPKNLSGLAITRLHSLDDLQKFQSAKYFSESGSVLTSVKECILGKKTVHAAFPSPPTII